MCLLTNRFSVLGKNELLFLTGTFGLGAWLAGMVFVQRGSGGESLNKMVLELKKKNVKILIFPEGTRRNTGQIHNFKKGAFHAAIHAQVPIIPFVVGSYKHIFDGEKKIYNEGKIFASVLPEISTKGLTSSDVEMLIEDTRSKMVDMYEKLSKY